MAQVSFANLAFSNITGPYWCLTAPYHGPLDIYVKLWVAHAPGMPGTFSPLLRVSNPDMHHGTCVTHVPWCMSGSLTCGFLWSRWRGKLSRHSRRMRNPQFCVSGKRTITRTKYDQDLGRLIPSLCQNQFTYWFLVTHSVYSKTNVPRDLIGHGAHVTIMWPIQQPYRNVKHQCSASMLCQIEW